MSAISQERPRANQKRRTRSAIVAAAVDLVRLGQTPSVADVADAAQVSRATAYRYFPSREFLLSEAALDSIVEDVSDAVSAVNPTLDARSRLDTMVRAVQEQTVRREASLRALLRLALEQPFEDRKGHRLGAQRRGGRRIDWIEQALGPVWSNTDRRTRERLIGALSLCMGVEGMVVMRDVCDYSPQQSIDICAWAAQAILQAALNGLDSDTMAGTG